MIESKGYKITPIDGDLAVSRNTEIGRDVDIHGKARVAGSLKVEGFLDAPNIKGAVKGLFATEEELKREYPNPRPGWCAIVLANKENGFLYLAKNREWEKQSEEAKPFDFIVDSINVFASKGELADETQRAQNAENQLQLNIEAEADTRMAAVDEIKGKAALFGTFAPRADAEGVLIKYENINHNEGAFSIPVATEGKAGVLSAEDKKKFVKSITWNNDTDQSNMNDFVVAGVYDIKGERTRIDDNLPILNTGSGHSFNARLTVLDSSISGSGKGDDRCITQVLSFSNRLGQGEVYIRTGKGGSLDNLTWEKWSTLQRNVNVGEVGSLDDLKDNGIYSGVWLFGSLNNYPLTFVCVVINDYFIGTAPRRVSQFVYGLSKFDGSVVYQSRVWDDSKDKWGDWEILNQKEISSMIKSSVDNAIKGVIADAPEAFDTLKEIADWIANDETGAVALANAISANTKAINTEVDRAKEAEKNIDDKLNDEIKRSVDADQGLLRNIDEEARRATEAEEAIKDKAVEADSLNFLTRANVVALDYKTIEGVGDEITIPAATTENAGVMSAGDKQMLYQSFVKSVGEFQSRNYEGIYCTNINTGNVANANSTSNGIVIPVKEGEVYEVVGENLIYGPQSIQFYNGYPSLDTNISNVFIRNEQVKVPQGATHMLVSVNPSLGTETTIRQLNWATIEDLPQSFKEVLENVSSEYKTQVINVTQGTAAGNNAIFPISMLGEGDIIQIYVESDIDTNMNLITFNGHVIQSIITNQIITKEITSNDITGNSFGFYINSVQATQSGTLNCYLRIVKKDSPPITLSKGLINAANASKDISYINKNLGSYYQELTANVEAGKLLDARNFISTDVEDGYIIEFIAECNEDITYRVLTQDGKYPFGNSYFSTNVLYSDICNSDFITSLQSNKNWGVYIPANKATVSATIHFKVRIISNDNFSLQHTIDNTKNQVNSLEDVFEDVFEIPNNNNYIKNWKIANKLVTRLYVENKELALADGLFIRQFFRALNNPTNNGFNFGTRNTGWAITIAPGIGDFDYYETTHATYGKIAIKIADWDAIEWPTSGVISIGALSESNLEDIVFDWDEFIKPLYPTTIIADGSVTENKLSEEVKDKLNSSAPPLSRYELFSLGDSLSSAGIWQTKVAQLTGCIFDQAKNNKAGAMLSVGGTSSYGDSFDNVLWRTKNLVDQNYIAGQGENAIVILENVNDGYQVFDGDAKSILPTNPIEGYNDADFGVELLESISDRAAINAVLRLNKVVAGKNLKIDTLPTKAGTVTLKVGWAGPGVSNYNIYVEPQATEEETLKHVLDKILEYSYTGITDVLGEDGRSVDFSSGNSNYLPTVQFTDTDNTGMTCTVTDNPNAKGSIARYFIGENVSEWTDTSKWQLGITYSQGWKSSIEMLQRVYPKLHIFVSMFPLHSVTASDYLLPNGAYDTVAYNSVSRMETMRNMQVELAKIAEFYSVPFINVFAECGIGINNMLTYYNATANVHPKNEGYYRFGETVAAQLKRFLA